MPPSTRLLYQSNLCRLEPDKTALLSDELVKAEVTSAFNENRAFPFFPVSGLITRIDAGTPYTDLREDLSRIRDTMADTISERNSLFKSRFLSDLRLIERVIQALYLIHKALAELPPSNLASRRFVLIKERPGWPNLYHVSPGCTVLSHVGQGPPWTEIPSIFLGLNLFDTVGIEQQKSELWSAFRTLLSVEERAIETGFIHIEDIGEVETKILNRLIDEVIRTSGIYEAVHREIKLPVQRPFSSGNRETLLELLDKRTDKDEMSYDHSANFRAIEKLDRLARRYKRSGDQRSLRECFRLLVAASGHDVHEVRNQANLLLERILAPKEYDAPLATRFVNLRIEETHYFHFSLPRRKNGYSVRIYRNNPEAALPTEKDLSFFDLGLEYDIGSQTYQGAHRFDDLGHYDFQVLWFAGGSVYRCQAAGCSGRINVMPDVSGEIVLEIFPDIHGHTRLYWDDGSGHPGLVYNEHGEVIRLGRFSDITAHLDDLKERYRLTAIYLLGVQRRGSNRQDWAPEATSPTPFSPMSLVDIEPSLGGEIELKNLIHEAHRREIKIIVDVIPHINRRSDAVPERNTVKCYDEGGRLVVRASSDGRYGSWNDGKLLNYRQLEVWEWLVESILKLIDDFDIDGIRFDSAHAVPIMMKKHNYPYTFGKHRSTDSMVEGEIIVNDREDDHYITTGYYDSACRDLIACPFHHYLMQRIEKKIRRKGKTFFMHLAECYWGRERFLARLGIIPYNSALFKICEKIIHGESDVREIYHLFDDYYPSILPPGTELLGILGNHDERRALNTFGQRGLRAAAALTSLMSGILMDYEGSAEGEGWKVYVDNIYVNWNQFENAAHRSLESFYQEIYRFHRNRGRAFLIWTDNPLVAAVMKFTEEGIWIGICNFSDSNQTARLHFDSPRLPLDDSASYRVFDPRYSPVTGVQSHYTGTELRISRIQTVVSYTDRVKWLKIERVDDSSAHYTAFVRESFRRLCIMDNPSHVRSSFAFLETAFRSDSFDRLASFISETLIPLFRENDTARLELGLKRIFFYISRLGIQEPDTLLGYIEQLTRNPESRLAGLGRFISEQNRRRPIVFLSSEADPFSKSGGLANVVYELPRELVKLGETVFVVTPMYRHGDGKSVEKMRQAVRDFGIVYTGEKIRFRIMDNEYEVGVHYGNVQGIGYYLLDHHELFDGLYWGYTAEEKLKRRVALARAAMELIIRFRLDPGFTATNDAFAGLFNGLARSDPYYRDHEAFSRNTFVHLIHNGGWQYFDSYHRYEGGFDNFRLFNLPAETARQFADPSDGRKLSCMASGVRFADRVFTVSPSYARQIETACDGLEVLLHDVIGVSNAIGGDFVDRIRNIFEGSGFVERYYPGLVERAAEDASLGGKLAARFPEILRGPRRCETISDLRRRRISTRMRNKLLLQLQRGFTVDPDRVLFTMIHRIAEQKGYQLLLESSEGLFRDLGFQGIVGGQTASGDQRGEELARGLLRLCDYYRQEVDVSIGFQDVSIPLLASDIFLMPSLHEPGGISQLEAMACGCLIVARATGGLRDTVTPLTIKGRSVSGNGFLFSDFSSWSFYDAMNRCAAFFRVADDEEIDRARRNAERAVFFWDKSARQYVEHLYGIKEIIRPVS